jgi:neutral ceramidase
VTDSDREDDVRYAMLLAAAWLAATGAYASGVELQAGLARIEITPSSPTTLAGYGSRKCTAAGTHDPLFAKVLVLATGQTRLAIVTVDLLSYNSQSLRADVADKLGIPVLLLAASHSHSGPELRPLKTDTPYAAELDRRVFGAIREAAGAMFPARLSVGGGSIQLGYNRLQPDDATGRSHALWTNPGAVAYGPVDPRFQLLRVEDGIGATRALLVFYACHGVVLGPSNCRYSADYPGAMQAGVEAGMKGVQCMFVQGAAGDINPTQQAHTGTQADFDTVARVGGLLAAEVLREARKIQPGPPVEYPIQTVSEVLDFGSRWGSGKRFHVGITTVLINRDIAMAAVPGEPLHLLQEAWKAQAEVRYPLFFGYTCSTAGDWPGYIPDLRSAAHGGYGADSDIEIGAGETIVQHHLKNLYGLLGMWQDKPGQP